MTFIEIKAGRQPIGPWRIDWQFMYLCHELAWRAILRGVAR